MLNARMVPSPGDRAVNEREFLLPVNSYSMLVWWEDGK